MSLVVAFVVAATLVRREAFPPAEREPGRLGRFVASAIAIFESVHFLFDDVRGLADGAAEELGLLQYRNPNLREIVGAEDLARLGFNRLPDLDLAREEYPKSL